MRETSLMDSLEKAALRVAHGVRAAAPPTLVQLYDNNFGLTLIALAQFFFASMSMSVKWLMETTSMSTLTLIFVRMGITGSCCWATLLLQRDPNPFLGPPGIRKLLCLRGFAGFSGLLCAYQALRGLSVSDAVTIGFLTPSVTAFFGWLVLGESFSIREAVSGVVSLFGVVLISRPPFLFGHHHDDAPAIEPEAAGPARVRLGSTVTGDPDSAARMIGTMWALVGVSFSATAYLSIRYIGTRASALHSISYFSMVCTIASALYVLLTTRLTSARCWCRPRTSSGPRTCMASG
jgi:drug/metabolite transporter (DMT)-like permease